MARKDRPLPSLLTRFGYWGLDIAAPLPFPPAWAPEPMPLAQDAREDTRATVHAILDGCDSPMHPRHRPDLRLVLDALGRSSEPDRRVLALRYWMALDRLWYEDADAWTVLRALPASQQQALRAFEQQRWAFPSVVWTWETLLPRIAQDQGIFRDMVAVGPTQAGVAPTSAPDIAPQRYGRSKTDARTIYVAYHRQAFILLGQGMRPPKAWAEAMHDEGLLNARGRIHAAPLGFSATPSPLLCAGWKIAASSLGNWEAVYHWFAHALRNLCRYRNGDTPPLPWNDAPICQRGCHAALQKLLARTPTLPPRSNPLEMRA